MQLQAGSVRRGKSDPQRGPVCQVTADCAREQGTLRARTTRVRRYGGNQREGSTGAATSPFVSLSPCLLVVSLSSPRLLVFSPCLLLSVVKLDASGCQAALASVTWRVVLQFPHSPMHNSFQLPKPLPRRRWLPVFRSTAASKGLPCCITSPVYLKKELSTLRNMFRNMAHMMIAGAQHAGIWNLLATTSLAKVCPYLALSSTVLQQVAKLLGIAMVPLANQGWTRLHPTK